MPDNPRSQRSIGRELRAAASLLLGLAPAALAAPIADGGFEAGSPNLSWTEASTHFGTPLCTVALCGSGGGSGPHAGVWWAWFGGVSTEFEESSVAQTVTIPAGVAPALEFYLEIPLCESLASGFVELTVDGTQLWSRTSNDPSCGINSYVRVVVGLGAYADGQNHAIRFHSITDDLTMATNFFVDDVALLQGVLLVDGFESGTTSAWSFPPP